MVSQAAARIMAVPVELNFQISACMAGILITELFLQAPRLEIKFTLQSTDVAHRAGVHACNA